jgi:hypothetical protein
MRGAIAIRIRICRGRPSVLLTDAPLGSRPSFLPPQIASHPNPSLPNWESTSRGGSFSPPAFRPPSSTAPRIPSHPNPRLPNRESRPSNIRPTHANQSLSRSSNRENNSRSQLTINPLASSTLSRPVRGLRRLVRARFQPCRNRCRVSLALAAEVTFFSPFWTLHLTRRPEFAAPNSNPHSQIPKLQSSKQLKITKNHPQSLFRLERTPTLYYHQLTRILIEPMFRLEREKAAEKARAKNPKIHPSQQQTSNFGRPAV